MAKLERRFGNDDLERRLRLLTDDELEAEIDDLNRIARVMLAERGVECTNWPNEQVWQRLEEIEEVEAAERNQERSDAQHS